MATDAPLQVAPGLAQWGRQVPLPRAFLEWAARDGGAIMERHGPGDDYWLGPGAQGSDGPPQILPVAEGIRGLVFERESQGNYDKAVVLDMGDDPPVLFGWCGQAPWIVHCLRFSDSVFAHVFDYQYAYDQLPGDSQDGAGQFDGQVERYTGSVPLRAAGPGLRLLRQRYPETVTTWGVVEDRPFAQYRFAKSPTERMTVTVGAGHDYGGAAGEAVIAVGGATDDLAVALEAELFDELAGQVLPLTFSSLRVALNDLDRHLRGGMTTRLHRSCVRPPGPDPMRALAAAGRSQALASRASGLEFPQEGQEFAVGGSAWGVTIRFQRAQRPWWRLETIELPS